MALLARSEAPLRQAAAEIGGYALPLATDVSDERSVAAAFARVGETFGTLNGLVNCAAVGFPVDLAEFSPAEFMAHFAVNVLGPALCTQAALPFFEAAGEGDVVNVSSISVDDPFPMLTPYAASKAALEAYSLGAQREMLARNVRVQVLRVGGMSGGKFAAAWDPAKAKRAMAMAKQQGRFSDRGPPMPAVVAAATVADMLALPRSAHAALLVLKPKQRASTAEQSSCQ